MKPALPFVGRNREVAQLRRLHARRGHALILGAEGSGKSALVGQLREPLDLRVCPASVRLGDICENLERELHLTDDDGFLVQRKNRLLKSIKDAKQTVVFDGAGWTTPKISSFLESAMERAPVWICARSEHARDIGHFWPLLVRFEHVELKPFHPKETQKLIEAAVRENGVSEKTLGIVGWLHRRAAGNPKILCELLTEIASGHYDLSNPHARQRLDLDRHIHEMFPVRPFDE